MNNFKSFSLIGLCLAVVACGQGNSGGGSGGGPAQGKPVAPSEIDVKEYPNSLGQITGSWGTSVNVKVDSGREIKATLKMYIGKQKTAVRLTCVEKGQVFADLAGIVAS